MLAGIKIAVLGGDDRELVLIAELVRQGAVVVAAGFPQALVAPGGSVAAEVEEALRGAEVVIMPLPGMNEEAVIRAVYAESELKMTESALDGMMPHALVIIGTARPFLKKWTEARQFTLLEVADMDELAILNSIPTVEGALQLAMQETKTTIHGSPCAVLGFGRVGMSMARVLKALGAEVTVVARNPGQLARAYEMGCKRAGYGELPRIMQSALIIFSTVPHLILTGEVLLAANPDSLIIDLANQPGSTDFKAAEMLGVKALLAPGLPGKVAPLSAGKILADVIPGLIRQELRAGVE
jgi:dipicolinate synthase subunit A